MSPWLSALQADYSLDIEAQIFSSEVSREGFQLSESSPLAVLFLENSENRIDEWNSLAFVLGMPALKNISESAKELRWAYGEDFSESPMNFVLPLEIGDLLIQLRPKKIDFRENKYLFHASIFQKDKEDSTSPSADNRILAEKELLLGYDRPEYIGVFTKGKSYIFSMKIVSWGIGIGISRPPMVKK